jgi:ADP-ribose pyrophosphatase YjhB (NUDIX family)
MRPHVIRPLALGIFLRQNHLLVFEGQDPHTGERFYRPLGGGIKFGERGATTVKRELREEIHADVDVVRFLGVLESIFTYNQQRGHEIVLLYETRFTNPSWYRVKEIEGQEDDGSPFVARWLPLTIFQEGRAPLYPEGLLAHLERQL